MSEFSQPTVRSSLLRVIGWMFAGLISCLAISFVAFGKTITEKFATGLVLPCGLMWLVLFGLSLFAFFMHNRRFGVVLLLSFVLYSLLGNGHLARALVTSLEAEFRQIDPLTQPPFDLVIVLGGGSKLGGNGRAEGNESGDRLILAASLYHRRITPILVCTGSRIEGLGDGQSSPAKLSAEILMALAVPEKAIEFAEGRTTSEELKNLSQTLQGNQNRIGIVTSAWHLPRTLRLAKSQGLILHPLPADFLCGPPRPQSTVEFMKDFIPEARNFAATSHALKEYLARLVGR